MDTRADEPGDRREERTKDLFLAAWRRFLDFDPRFFHFRLCACEDYPKPPLGWALSKRSWENFATHFDACGNKQQFCRLVAALAPYLPVTEDRSAVFGTRGIRRLTLPN